MRTSGQVGPDAPGAGVPHLHDDPGDCCGCSACYCACPTGAISMLPDEEGFLYPRIDEDSCIRCLRCHSVCAFKVDQAARGV